MKPKRDSKIEYKKGHSLSDLEVIILEQVPSQDPLYRKERERYLIRKFNSFYNGMNKSPGLIVVPFCDFVKLRNIYIKKRDITIGLVKSVT